LHFIVTNLDIWKDFTDGWQIGQITQPGGFLWIKIKPLACAFAASLASALVRL
jgi:hypothetical protein